MTNLGPTRATRAGMSPRIVKGRLRRAGLVAALMSPAIALYSCKENLPSGPATFAATLSLLGLPDTLVSGDSRLAQVQAKDAQGNLILNLAFTWSVADAAVAGLGAADTGKGGSRTVIAKATGRSNVTAALPDARFVVSNAAKQLTVVVGGVRITSSRDTALSAVNDTGVAVAAGLVRAGTILVPATKTGLRWVHRGTAASGTGVGDTLRYVARANGVDTLVVSHDFCLMGARCADTALIRVNQQVKLALSARTFQSWSLGDTVGPTVSLVDRRGNGLPGASVRFVPATRADSGIVSVTAPVGITNPITGVMAAPRLAATANGTGKVRVLAVGPTGATVDVDSITDVVRQVARRVAVDPLRSQITEVDSLPARPIARDARGQMIADATLTPTVTGVLLANGFVYGVARGGPYTGKMWANLTGVADPAVNPGAPQVVFTTDTAQVAVTVADSAAAGATARTFTALVFDATGQVAAGRWVRFLADAGLVVPDSALTDINGNVTVNWTPPNASGRHVLTGLLRGATPPVTVADSAGLVVLRRSVFVNGGPPSPIFSTMAMSITTIPKSTTATLTVVVRDSFGNVVTGAVPTDIVVTVTTGAIGPVTCVQGTCSATYTAPGAPGPDSIAVTIMAVAILNSPIALTIF
jgi:hypothetical protein